MWKTTHHQEINTKNREIARAITETNQQILKERERIDGLASFLIDVKLRRRKHSEYITCSVELAPEMFRRTNLGDDREYMAQYVARYVEREVRTTRILPERNTREEMGLRDVRFPDRIGNC